MALGVEIMQVLGSGRLGLLGPEINEEAVVAAYGSPDCRWERGDVVGLQYGWASFQIAQSGTVRLVVEFKDRSVANSVVPDLPLTSRTTIYGLVRWLNSLDARWEVDDNETFLHWVLIRAGRNVVFLFDLQSRKLVRMTCRLTGPLDNVL